MRRKRIITIFWDDSEQDYKFYFGTPRQLSRQIKKEKRTNYRLLVDTDIITIYRHKDLSDAEDIEMFAQMEEKIDSE